MAGWQLITFYTTGTGYETEVRRLLDSAAKVGLECHAYAYEPTGTWRGNLNYKSVCILRAMSDYPDKDIVFVDADAIIHRRPELFDKLSEMRRHEVGAHFHPYMQSVGGGSLLSGTLWLANTERGRQVVEMWHEIAIAHPDIRHQHALNVAIHEMRAKGIAVGVYRLPREYTLIYDYYKGHNRPKNPVIEHFQASRKLRKVVGRGPMLLHSNFLRLKDKGRGRMPQQRIARARKYPAQRAATRRDAVVIDMQDVVRYRPVKRHTPPGSIGIWRKKGDK